MAKKRRSDAAYNFIHRLRQLGRVPLQVDADEKYADARRQSAKATREIRKGKKKEDW